jgi:hypothetical protein
MRLACAIILSTACGVRTLPAQTASPVNDTVYVVEYYYTARWGYAEEFWRLYVKNHLPVMMLEKERGHIRDLVIERPRFHGTEDGRWDFRVRITYPSAAEHATASPVTADDRRRLFPDQATFVREEQRRFEILLAHWDLPVERIAPGP